ncbi:hypothetical protein [Streptomyces broussonetiae]|uniref:hypothetical protein n=1 Tax=Streptomyces broussonetiae TaxID=2686304 RepID=UPI001E4B75AB|nr:hypothetical protein [Streptomyces broussonetiae]
MPTARATRAPPAATSNGTPLSAYSTYRSTNSGESWEASISTPGGTTANGRATPSRVTSARRPKRPASPTPASTRHTAYTAQLGPRNTCSRSSAVSTVGLRTHATCAACPLETRTIGSSASTTAPAARPQPRHSGRPARASSSEHAWAHSSSTANSCSQQVRPRTAP